MPQPKEIHIKGARVHNLKNIELRIPHNRLIVITGLSGSGKSTLAFDTIFAEGQRRYVESLSAYARQFLGRIEKPEVDYITGIAPAIAIEQKVNSRNPRSTVGTTTEIYDYLKLLFARIGRTYSPVSGCEVTAYSVAEVVDSIVGRHIGERIEIAAPPASGSGMGMVERLMLLVREGYQRVLVEGESLLIDEALQRADEIGEKELLVIIDRAKVMDEEEFISRMGDSVAKCFEVGDGTCAVISGGRTELFSSRMEADGILFEQPTEHLFSFNNPMGACPVCDGYGKIIGIDEELVIPDKTRTVYDDAIACWKGETMRAWRDELVMNAPRFGFPVHRPYYELTKEEKGLLWQGNEYFKGLNKFFRHLESERYKIQYRVMLSRYTGKTLCPQCGGTRLRREALYVRVGGLTIADMAVMPVERLAGFFDTLRLDDFDRQKSARLTVEICNRLEYLCRVGLGYLTLDRLSSTLSGGESQRINLSTSLGSSLVGSLYILDEPSIGLHPRDTNNLIGVLRQLRDLGNTVIVVEHEEEVIRAADRIVDIGPLAGYRGGEVLFNGTLEELEVAAQSLTSEYLFGRRRVAPKESYRPWRNYIEITGARENNLKGISVRIPLGAITSITGVSGSGKSSLVNGILYPALRRELFDIGQKPGGFDRLSGDYKLLRGVELVDQNPIGKSSRSNPVTYIKAYDDIRKLFADQPYAKSNGFTPSHFSFNIAGGRCEECQGEGVIRVSMQFMADVELKCETCGGRRFKEDILEVTFRGRNIYDILEMNVDEALDFFRQDKSANCRRITEKLKTLHDVGLGYIKLGQSSSTLSGGESQRVKLASFLIRENDAGPMLFIFDEPTTGLHFHDISSLMSSLDALMLKGHTIVIVEHNMEVIAASDWVIDLGPEAGESGGEVVFEGTPRDLALCRKSHTGRFLAKRINKQANGILSLHTAQRNTLHT